MNRPSTPTATAGPGQQGDKLPLAAGAGALAAGQLHAVGDVQDHRAAQAPHDGQAAEIHHQVVVAEHGAPLGEEDPAIAGGADLVHHRLHVPGGQELAFFDIDHLAGPGRGHQQVGLAAEKGRDLQDVQDLGGGRHVGDLVDVGEDRQAHLGLDPGQDLQALAQPRPAVRGEGGAVGLVKGGLEDQRQVQLPGIVLQGPGDLQGGRGGLDDAGPGDEDQVAGANREIPVNLDALVVIWERVGGQPLTLKPIGGCGRH